MIERRRLALFTGATLALPSIVQAQPAWPSQPIRLVVPFGPGGGTDISIRMLQPKMQEFLGQPIVIENRPGGGSTVGTDNVAKSPPDGYSFVHATLSSTGIAATLYRNLPYDPVRDFAPIGRIGVFPLMLAVHPSVPAQTIGELITLARSRPGQLTFGHWSAVYLAAGKTFIRQIGAEVLDVPYRASAATMTDLVAGRVSFAMVDLTIGLPLARGGEVRRLP